MKITVFMQTHQKIKDLMKDKHRSVYHKSVFSLGDLASASCDHKPSKGVIVIGLRC